jgi:3-oxosteroid 1-dehydrogenase
MVTPADTGEIIEEAIRIGAAVSQMDECIGSPMALLPGNPPRASTVQNEICKPHSIVVDQSGVRYMCEAGSYVDIYRAMLARNKQVPAIASWFVVDSQYIRKYMFLGAMSPAKLRPWIEQGFLRKAETLEELAKNCGMDPAKLKASVERFNGFAIKGRDEDFHRGERAFDKWLGDRLHSPSTSLGPLQEGPFYAVQIYPGNVSTWGGVVTDAHARVLRADGTVIPGLYATGNTAATVMAHRTPGPGTSVGPAVTWGYVAAKHAVSADAQTSAHSQGKESIVKQAGAR